MWPSDAVRYVEPFAGSACLYFKLRPSVARLSDINAELITFYAILVADPEGIHRELARLGGASRETYYAVRALEPALLPPAQRAARFLYLNCYCFNGLYRTNSRDEFNVPFGGEKSGHPPNLDRLKAYAKALSPAELVTDDFEGLIREVRAGDFVYLDPPYAVESQWRRGLHYTASAFAVDDVGRLRATLTDIDRSGAVFLLSYADSPEGRRLAAGYSTTQVEVRRSIAGSSLRRVRAPELLISNRPFPTSKSAAAAA